MTLAEALQTYLAANDPEGFGCACSPTTTCGPCLARIKQAPLYAALAEHEAQQQEPTNWPPRFTFMPEGIAGLFLRKHFKDATFDQQQELAKIIRECAGQAQQQEPQDTSDAISERRRLMIAEIERNAILALKEPTP
jgi:hypothetical protein